MAKASASGTGDRESAVAQFCYCLPDRLIGNAELSGKVTFSGKPAGVLAETIRMAMASGLRSNLYTLVYALDVAVPVVMSFREFAGLLGEMSGDAARVMWSAVVLGTCAGPMP